MSLLVSTKGQEKSVWRNIAFHPFLLKDKRIHLIALLLAFAPTIVKIVCYPQYIGSDDSYIHLQVARNVLTGSSWGVNPGHPVNLSTSPLFTIFVIVALFLFHSSFIIVLQAASCLATTMGLYAIFLRTWKTTEKNVIASLCGLGSAAFACMLWRWNGVLMETTFAFCAVALVLLFFSDYRLTPRKAAGIGVFLGLSALLRPELLTLSLVCVSLSLCFGQPGKKYKIAATMTLGICMTVATWLIFAHLYFGSFIPTTFYAKTTTHIIFWNRAVLAQYGALVALSMFWPSLLWAACIPVVLRKPRKRLLQQTIWLPIIGAFAFAAFYYFKTPGLESAGRYLLPIIPMICVGGAELLARAMTLRPHAAWVRFVCAVLVLHLGTSLYFNSRLIAPVLVSFQNGYFASMRHAAAFVAGRALPSDRVLAEIDIGVLSYFANGKFIVADGGGLGSPELAHKSIDEKIAIVHPRFLVESQGTKPGDLANRYPHLLPIWHSSYRGHGLSTPKELFVNIYALQGK